MKDGAIARVIVVQIACALAAKLNADTPLQAITTTYVYLHSPSRASLPT